MNCAIQTNSAGLIVARYAGTSPLPAPWIAITAAQFGQIVNGSTWSGSAVVAPVAPVLTAAQQLQAQAQAMLLGTLGVNSTSTPALNAAYAVNQQAQNNITAVQLYIQTNGKFPGSTGTYTWPDATGTGRVFPSVAVFTAFATAVADFVSDCTAVLLSGTGTLPPTTVTIE